LKYIEAVIINLVAAFLFVLLLLRANA